MHANELVRLLRHATSKEAAKLLDTITLSAYVELGKALGIEEKDLDREVLMGKIKTLKTTLTPETFKFHAELSVVKLPNDKFSPEINIIHSEPKSDRTGKYVVSHESETAEDAYRIGEFEMLRCVVGYKMKVAKPDGRN